MSARLAELYGASLIKRPRATRGEMEWRRQMLAAIVEEHQPCSVRGVFYQAAVRGVIEKVEKGYDKVQRVLADLRLRGLIPFDSIVDNTRWQRKPLTFDSMAEAAAHTARTYRRAVWTDLDIYVEVWLEKDALAGVMLPVTAEYDVPLMVARGYSSLTFLHESAAYMSRLGKKVVILHFGDWDPSGQNSAEAIEKRLRQFAPGIDIRFHRCAVAAWQIEKWNLPSRPTKKSDSRSKTWTGGDSVELDAIPAPILRDIVQIWIEELIPAQWLKAMKAAEESERDLLSIWAEHTSVGRKRP